jgi:predicted unusual protein kinase regulating ubiquinone biosynthesis (AarF/ABC1/UbiB family)
MELWLIVLSIFVGSRNNKIVDAQNMIKDIQSSILRETDFTNEVNNMERMRTAVEETKRVKIPKVYKKFSSSEAIVMEYVPSKKFRVMNDPNLAYALMDIFVQQFLQYGLIHGDPHEGNIALGKDGKIVMYDLGHIIHLDSKVRSMMKMLVFEIMTENVDGVIQIMKQMPQLVEIREEEKIKSYIATYIRYIKTIDINILKNMSKENPTDIPIKFSGAIYEIVRSFGIVEGICINMDPNFNYETVFLKYIDILLVDSEFISYKVQQDLQTFFNAMKFF